MKTGLEFTDELDKLQELKESNYSKNDKIKMYKDFLLNDCEIRLPDICLELVARKKLDLEYTEEELNNIKNKYEEKKSIIEYQNNQPVVNEIIEE